MHVNPYPYAVFLHGNGLIYGTNNELVVAWLYTYSELHDDNLMS